MTSTECTMWTLLPLQSLPPNPEQFVAEGNDIRDQRSQGLTSRHDWIWRVLRVVSYTIALFVLFMAGILTMSALATPRWQRVDLPVTRQTHLHGLYEDCVLDWRSDTWSCEYKRGYEWWYTGLRNRDRLLSHMHTPRQWQTDVVCLLAFAIVGGMLAFLCGLGSTCVRYCQCRFRDIGLKILLISWIFLTLLSFLFSLAGISVFFKESFAMDNRIILDRTDSAEQTYDSSFSLAIAGCASYLLAGLFAIAATMSTCAFGCICLGSRDTISYSFVPKNCS